MKHLARKNVLLRYFFCPLLFLAFLCATSYSSVKVRYLDEGVAEVYINFLLPMHQESLAPKISVAPEIPLTSVSCEVKWLSSTKVALKLAQTGCPEGQLLTFEINRADSLVPFIKKSVGGKVRPPVPLKLLSNSELHSVPSRGPVPIVFNTPVEPASLKKQAVLPAPGRLEPVCFSVDGKEYVDYSRWQYHPAKALKYRCSNNIVLSPEIRSMGGRKLGETRTINLKIARPPRVVSTVPARGAGGVRLYERIEFTLDQEVANACVKVTEVEEGDSVPGETIIDGNKVSFQPARVYLPGKKYSARLRAESKDGDPLDEYEFSFHTVDMGEKVWVEVELHGKNMVTVYRGSKVIRRMLASGGKLETPTPRGYFYTQDRGYSFWSHRFQEGATYWVRLVGSILVHSVPRDSNWRIKEDAHEKLGLPASHGCIRLDEEDAKWFFENIPRGTLVIIH